MNGKKRILICGLAQESNSFNPVAMPLDQIKPHSTQTSGHANVSGGREYLLSKEDVECIWGVCMRGNSAGPLKDEVVEHFLADTLGRIDDAGHLDGVLMLLHGATLSESCDDVCGYVCETIREKVGDGVVISAGFDLHGNITERIAKNLDYISGYWEYPHIDQRESGERAAALLYGHLCGEPKVLVRAAIPMMAPAHAYTTTRGALLALNQKAQAMIREGRIADYTAFQVQPWLDAPEVQSTVIVIAKDEAAATEVANELTRDVFHAREELQGTPLMTPAQVIERALENKSRKPVILVDSADSVGAGSTGDSAAMVEAFLPYADCLRMATSVKDAKAVAKAFELGVGGEGEFTLGASVAPKLSRPVTVKAKVRSLHEGTFYHYGPIYQGSRLSPGRVAVLEVGKLLIRVGLNDVAGGDLNFFQSFGIDVTNCQLVAVKACTSFRVGYEPVSAEICNACTAGAACPSLLDLPFERLLVPTYPFQEIEERDVQWAKRYR